MVIKVYYISTYLDRVLSGFGRRYKYLVRLPDFDIISYDVIKGNKHVRPKWSWCCSTNVSTVLPSDLDFYLKLDYFEVTREELIQWTKRVIRLERVVGETNRERLKKIKEKEI